MKKFLAALLLLPALAFGQQVVTIPQGTVCGSAAGNYLTLRCNVTDASGNTTALFTSLPRTQSGSLMWVTVDQYTYVDNVGEVYSLETGIVPLIAADSSYFNNGTNQTWHLAASFGNLVGDQAQHVLVVDAVTHILTVCCSSGRVPAPHVLWVIDSGTITIQ